LNASIAAQIKKLRGYMCQQKLAEKLGGESALRVVLPGRQEYEGRVHAGMFGRD
jgi:hypothetical protein